MNQLPIPSVNGFISQRLSRKKRDENDQRLKMNYVFAIIYFFIL